MCCIKRDDLEGSAVPAFPERSFLNDNKAAFDRPLDIEELKQYTKFNEGTTEQDLLGKTSEAYAPPYDAGNDKSYSPQNIGSILKVMVR